MGLDVDALGLFLQQQLTESQLEQVQQYRLADGRWRITVNGTACVTTITCDASGLCEIDALAALTDEMTFSSRELADQHQAEQFVLAESLAALARARGA